MSVEDEDKACGGCDWDGLVAAGGRCLWARRRGLVGGGRIG